MHLRINEISRRESPKTITPGAQFSEQAPLEKLYRTMLTGAPMLGAEREKRSA